MSEVVYRKFEYSIEDNAGGTRRSFLNVPSDIIESRESTVTRYPVLLRLTEEVLSVRSAIRLEEETNGTNEETLAELSSSEIAAMETMDGGCSSADTSTSEGFEPFHKSVPVAKDHNNSDSSNAALLEILPVNSMEPITHEKVLNSSYRNYATALEMLLINSSNRITAETNLGYNSLEILKILLFGSTDIV
ncbi:hypothetical protein HZH66_010504 [Vespula vulgaris]|uniref:Uncharacterized protein n=1 Tax=Vespula vulgaris TaxID=7454 RepID=A0A834JLL3_VESVU|nr:hypothetical protein HZH66_010504 [Vespula vulgaris]